MNRTHAIVSSLAAGVAFAGSATADVMWDEAIDGDLSTDYMNPTQLFSKATGSNHVIFTTVGAADNGGEQDREYFTFTIDEGFQLSALYLSLFETDPASNLGFIGVASGTSMPTSPDAPNPTTLLGYALVGTGDVGNDILQSMGTGAGSQGFSGPLGPGSYTFWVQETGPSTDNWDLDFVIEATTPVVPGPGVLAGLVGIACLTGRRRRG